MDSLLLLFSVGVVLSGIAIRIGISLSSQLGMVDSPGGHKLHDHGTPFVGGIGVFIALLAVLMLSAALDISPTLQWPAIALGAALMFITGMVDDLRHLGFRVRFLIQACAALVMILGAGVVLSDLGQLAFGQTLNLGLLAIPFTVFATIGVINALNMIDGIDGLSSSVSLVSLALLMPKRPSPTWIPWINGSHRPDRREPLDRLIHR
jgi:UDP-N-acetylmuramyl pentapeptide phosphotransferase/UDP-N-acetylglucosamine-1-phosphate transferase